MAKGGAAQPAAADPAALAQAQSGANITSAQNQAALNNINTYSPWGSSVYTPSTNAQGQTTYGLQQTLSPELQQLFGSQTSLAQLLSQGATGVGGAAPGVAGVGQNILTSNVPNAVGQVPTNLDLSGVAPITQLTPGSFKTNVAQGPIQSSVNTNFGDLTQQAQDAAYKSSTQYLDPQFQQTESDLRQRLADQGIEQYGPTGAENPAYARAIGDFQRQKQSAYTDARNQAVAAGNAQQQALFGESLGAGQFANAAQGQQFGQGTTLANLYNQAVEAAAGQQNTAAQLGLQRAQAQAGQPINALQALLAAGTGTYGAGLSGMGQSGQFINQAPTWPISIPTMGGTPATVAPTNLGQLTSAATGQNQLANTALNNNLRSLGGVVNQGLGLFGGGGGGGYSPGGAASTAADVASMWGGGGEGDVAAGLMGGGGGSTLGNIAGIAAKLAPLAIMAFSDRRLKEDITRIGTADTGLPLHLYRYKGDPRFRVGVMADEVEQVRPEAVREGPGGFKMVDYARALAPA